MKIYFNSQNCNFNTNFKSVSGRYKSDKKEIGFYTWFFREDLDWKNFTQYILNNFQNANKVNIIHFGSSDGSEAFTQVLSLLNHSDKTDTGKFFPIIAYDIKDSLVNMSNSGLININHKEQKVLDNNSATWRKHFVPVNITPSAPGESISLENSFYLSQFHGQVQTYWVSDEIRKNVVFYQDDMFNILPNIKDESNTVIFCRNCLSYCTLAQVKEFIRILRDVLKKDSLFCVGNLEHYDECIDNLLKQNGFKQIMTNVYKRL